MRFPWHSFSGSLLLLASLGFAGKERISILNFEIQGVAARKLVTSEEIQDLTQQVRDQAAVLVDTSRFEIMTLESILVMLPPGKKSLEECEGQCEVVTARNLGSRWHVVGDVKKVGSSLVLSIRLYDVASGSQLGGERIEGGNVDALAHGVSPKAVNLLTKIPGLVVRHENPPPAIARTASGSSPAQASRISEKPGAESGDSDPAPTAVIPPSAVVYDSVTDSRDGQRYRTVKIGDQIWMAENSRFKTDDSWCYDNDKSNCKIYGRLYIQDAAGNACPEKFRIPTDSEWIHLIQSTGGKSSLTNLRSKDDWKGKDRGADLYGFNLRPTGERFNGVFFGSTFAGIDYSHAEFGGTASAFLWIGKGGDLGVATFQKNTYILSEASDYLVSHKFGLAVRCIREPKK